MSKLLTNTTDLQEVLQTLQNKVTGTTLPELSNEGSASDLLNGEQLINSKGKVVVGTMPNNGTIASTMDGINTKSITIPQGYTSGGTVSLDNTIDNEVNTQAKLISQIVNALENKSVEVEYKEVEWSENEYAIIDRTISSYTNGSIKSIGVGAFACCRNLESVDLPMCISIYGYKPTGASPSLGAFQYCDNLTSVNFPACTNIGSNAFYECSNLTTVSFPACTTISAGAFYMCYNLKSLYLTGSSLCKLSKSNAFTSTPIGGYSASAGTYGSIYVPASLLTSYQTATNWTYFSSRFVGI